MERGQYLMPGDIFLTRGGSFVSRAIRYFSKTGGESRTEVNHVGIVTVSGTSESATIVEAMTKVTRRHMGAYRRAKNTDVAVYRPLNASAGDLVKIVGKANDYVGAKYGYIKILAHLLDWLLGGRYFFRRFAFMDRYPICSWVVAYAYLEGGYTFGVEAGGASPDDIWDFVTANPDKYECIHPLNKLP